MGYVNQEGTTFLLRRRRYVTWQHGVGPLGFHEGGAGGLVIILFHCTLRLV
jgi:hypothetical protein